MRNRLRRDDPAMTVAIGAILGAIGGLAGAAPGMPTSLPITIAAATTGVIAAIIVKHFNSHIEWECCIGHDFMAEI